jgi:hypothetical protein
LFSKKRNGELSQNLKKDIPKISKKYPSLNLSVFISDTELQIKVTIQVVFCGFAGMVH